MDIYIRRIDGQVTGPHSEAWFVDKAAEGGIAMGDYIAIVENGDVPTDEDYRLATDDLLDEIAPGWNRPTAAPDASAAPGGFLRAVGGIIGALGTLAALFGAIDSSSYSAEFNWSLAIAGITQALFYGGLLWAAGTVVGQLDDIKRLTARS